MLRTSKLSFSILLIIAVALIAGLAVWRMRPAELPEGIVYGNGRLEATEVDVATKMAGRIESLLPREGDQVGKGQVLAVLDAEELAAQLRAAEARVVQAQAGRREAEAGVRKAASDRELALKTLQRSQELVARNFISAQKLDTDRSVLQSAQADLAAAEVRVAGAEAALQAAIAQSESLRASVSDTTIRAPIGGRVLYRLAEPGEVVAAGGKVLTLLDLEDVFMTVFLPSHEAGQLRLGSEARIVLDTLPQQPVPARVMFVSPRAQFTPREVETRSEREKLMFRVKVRIDAGWLAAYPDLVKSGMPGLAYLRLDAARDWPANLQAK